MSTYTEMDMKVCCMRCGSITPCQHPADLSKYMSSHLAGRIRSYWALGRDTNPDHDTTSYYKLALDADGVTVP